MRTYTLELTEKELNQLGMTVRFGKVEAEKIVCQSTNQAVRESWQKSVTTLNSLIENKILPLERAAHYDRHAEANGVPFIGKDVENPSECECAYAAEQGQIVKRDSIPFD